MSLFNQTASEWLDDGRRNQVFEYWKRIVFSSFPVRPAFPRLGLVDLFCGAGGLTVGASEAIVAKGIGVKIALAVDTDEKAVEVYRKNLNPANISTVSVANLVRYSIGVAGNTVRFIDDPTITSKAIEFASSVDIVIGGPPCQGHSGLNNKSRRVDPRNSLYISAVAFAVGVKAQFVILENVPEVVRSNVNVIKLAVSLLEESGYYVDSGLLMASDLGWPQNRKRHFLVASKFGTPNLRGVADRFRERSIGAAEFLSLVPDRGGLLDEIPDYSDVTRERIQYFQGNPGVYDLPLSERPKCHKNGTTYGSVYGRMRPDEPIPTLTSGFLTPGRGRFIHPTEPRTLTPGEAAFAQGFPSWYSFQHPQLSRSDLTKWIGDAVPIPLGYIATLSAIETRKDGF